MNADIIGFIAGTLTSSAFIPQVIMVAKTKNTSSISLYMYLLFIVGVALWLVYGIFINKLPIIILNSITIFLASIILFIKVRNLWLGVDKSWK